MGELVAQTIRVFASTVAWAVSLLLRSAFRLFTNPIGWALLAGLTTGIALIATQAALALGIVIVSISGGVAIALTIATDVRDHRLHVQWLQSSLSGHPDSPAVAAQWYRTSAPREALRPRPAQPPTR